MKRIWKYPLPQIGVNATISMPPGKVVRVGIDGNNMTACAWVEHTATEDREYRDFIIVATGQSVSDDFEYAGSFQIQDEIMWTIWHVFERVRA